MITCRIPLELKKFPYTAGQVLDHLEHAFAPLATTGNKEDSSLYTQARGHIDYFRRKFHLEEFRKPDTELTNWQFLQLLAGCWRALNIAENTSATSQDLSHRLGLEDAGIRTMHRYKICLVNLFPGQQTYSIYGFDPGVFQISLRATIEQRGKAHAP